jgi:phosphatidylglycerol---prolipoprotein diacylglyceryl transferase
MRPILFQWRKLTIWSYPAMLYSGLVAGVAAGNLAAREAGIDTLHAYIATLILIIPALAGARLLFVAVHWGLYRHNLPRMWNRREGGYIMYGGLPVVLLLSIPLLRALQLNFGMFWDVSSFTILVGMIFTRTGCFLNGCCFGRKSSSWLSMRLPDHRGIWDRRLPTQIFEGLCAGLMLICAILIWRSRPFPGSVFLFVTLGYSLLRFLTEFAREAAPGASRFRIAHVISSIAFLSSAAVLLIHWRG